MKKIYSILSAGLSLLALSALAPGCVEEVPEVIEEVQLSNLLTPSSTSYVIDSKNGYTVTFTWTNSKAANYRLEVYAFETEDENTPDTAEEITEDILASVPDNMKFVYDVAPSESGSTTSYPATLQPEWSLYARVCAQSSADPDTRTTGDSKWAVFKYPIETYTVMDPVASVTVTDRTANSITISWSLEEGDNTGINQVRVYNFGTDDLQAYERVDVDNPTTTENSAVISNLTPSTKYTVAVHYNSANRGQQFVWTTPNWDGVSEAKDTADLKQLLRDAGDAAVNTTGEPLRIQLTNTEVPYDLEGVVDILGPVEILGDQTTEGKSPVVLGGFKAQPALTDYSYSDTEGVRQTISSTIGATSVRLEALDLDGDAYGTDRPYKLAADFPTDTPLTFEMINCDVHAYKSGFFYDNEKVAGWDKILIDNNVVTDIQGSGGDGFDIRKAGTINSIEITNNTIDAGFRDFIRIDVEAGGTSVNSFLMDHNTINNLAGSEASETRRVFYVRAATQSFTVSDNLFMNIEKQIFTHSGSDGVDPKTMTRNFFYNCSNEKFFETLPDGQEERKDEFTQDFATSGGGAVVSSDPCYNSGRSIFNVTNAAVLEAGSGDPRWLVDYIVVPDPVLTPVNESDAYMSTGAYTWNLTDLETFYESIDADCRQGNIQFYIDETPITVDEEGFHFTGEATTEYSGVPTDGALAFLVSERGSVVVSTQVSGSSNDHITVAYGPADGSSAAVEGAIAADANGSRVVFPDITAPTMIYLYACGPITMTTLSWISDVTTIGPTKLDLPENLQLSVTDPVDDSFTGNVTLSWDPVAGAGSYQVSIYGPLADKATDMTAMQPSVETVTEPTYSISNATSLEAGVYLYSVQAFPASGDATREESDPTSTVIGEAPALVRTETLEAVSENVITTWGHDEFLRMQQIAGTDENFTPVWESLVHNNLEYVSNTKEGRQDKDRTIRFATSESKACFQTPGSSSNPPDRRYLKFLASGNGSLKVTFDATSAGRKVLVSVAGSVLNDGHEASITGAGSFTEAITAVKGDPIIIFADASLRIFEVSWTPEGYDPDATIPSSPKAVETQTNFMTYFTGKEAFDVTDALETPVPKIINYNNDDEVTFVGKGGKEPKAIQWDGERIKLQGASTIDEDTKLPTANYISFMITKPGTIKHYIRSGSSDPTKNPRYISVDLLINNETVKNVYYEAAPIDGYKAGSEISIPVTKEDLLGAKSAVTVYISIPTNSCNVYYLEYIPD